jgi:hypothetical protein
VVVVQDHRGEQVHGLPVLIRGGRDRLRCGQPPLRQPWPPTTTPYRFAVHGSTLPGHSAGVTVFLLRFHSIGCPTAAPRPSPRATSAGRSNARTSRGAPVHAHATSGCRRYASITARPSNAIRRAAPRDQATRLVVLPARSN